MNIMSRIWLPAAVSLAVAAATFAPGSQHPEADLRLAAVPVFAEPSGDTVIYEAGGYKRWRRGEMPPSELPDSLLAAFRDSTGLEEALDTLPKLRARDTIKAPDSLRLTDPFRYKYYVALVDSLTHVETRDSLRHSSDSLKESALLMLEEGDTIRFTADSLHARLDSLDWRKLDSLYAADSTAAAKAAFEKWYASLDKKARRKYDYEQMIPIKMARMDSIKKAKEEKKAIRDSIIMEKPRILDTYAIPDSMQYKRIIAWTEDRDFGQLKPFVPDTGYNYHFYNDYPFRRKDVNATWLGVDGSPLQYYNWFNRIEDRDVTFYEAQRPWAFDPSTVVQYNSKTPHTELAYYGTLLAGDEKESDNLHILTTQNITPEMNFTLAYDRFGGGGMLINESTTNKNFTAVANWLGKKYTMNTGYIYNMVKRGENGGISDNSWIRDTTVDAREIKINLTTAESKIKKNTFFLDQQLRIPFNFINTLRARRDSTFVPDSAATDITTAFIGHSSEFSTYTRKYTDKIGTSDTFGRDLYSGIFNLDPTSSADSMRVSILDNKVYLRLQPWSADAIVSKLDVGIGDTWKTYYAPSPTDTSTVGQNSFYLYAGAQGQYKHYFNWNAKGRYDLQGYTAGDMLLEASAKGNFYPFRRARTSPLSVAARFSTSLKAPGYYQNHIYSNHYQWDNSFGKISTTRFEAELDIPHWKLNAKAGYALLSGNIWYDSLGVVRQNTTPMSVLGVSVRKDFTIADFLHLDNRVLFQYSSNQDVLPLPTLALNLKYYVQFVVQRDASKTSNVMVMQIGADALWNTAWHTPGWNPNLGVFHNQSRILYNNGPVFDAFINVQWKRACIFIKYENAGQGWPLEKAGYFTADHYVYTQRSLRLGLFWPFYIQSARNDSVGGHSH